MDSSKRSAQTVRRISALLLFSAAGLLPSSAWAFPEGAEAGHTGAPGQNDCSVCHFAGAEPTEQSGLSLHGLPESVAAGTRYELALRLSDPEARVGGFQLFAAGAESGKFEPGEGQKTLQRTNSEGTKERFVTHTHPASTEAYEDGEQVTEWSFQWTAPDELDDLMFYIAAVAGDGDDSPIGDNVYLLEVPVR